MGNRKGRNSKRKRLIRSKLVRGRAVIECPSCLKPHPEKEMTIDHIVPLSKGGTWSAHNLQLLCKMCNHKKGNSWDLEEVFKKIEQEKKQHAANSDTSDNRPDNTTDTKPTTEVIE